MLYKEGYAYYYDKQGSIFYESRNARSSISDNLIVLVSAGIGIVIINRHEGSISQTTADSKISNITIIPNNRVLYLCEPNNKLCIYSIDTKQHIKSNIHIPYFYTNNLSNTCSYYVDIKCDKMEFISLRDLTVTESKIMPIETEQSYPLNIIDNDDGNLTIVYRASIIVWNIAKVEPVYTINSIFTIAHCKLIPKNTFNAVCFANVIKNFLSDYINRDIINMISLLI